MSKKINLKAIVNVLCALIIVGALIYSYDFVSSLKSRFSTPVNYSYIPIVVAVDDVDVVYTSPPVRLDIASIGLSIDVVPGNYNYSDGTWTVSSDKANFAVMTSVPNPKSGNTFIYGHNRINIFASLARISVGDRAIVTTQDGKVFTYELDLIKSVDQHNTSNLDDSETPILTLQTCSGFWTNDRTMYVFNFVNEA